MFFPATAHFSLAFLISTLVQSMPWQGPALGMLVVLQDLRHPFQRWKCCLRQQGSALQALRFPPCCSKHPFNRHPTGALVLLLSTWTTALQMASLLKYFLKIFIFLSKPGWMCLEPHLALPKAEPALPPLRAPCWGSSLVPPA